MLEAKCTKSTYTYNDEQHPFLDVNVGDVVLFEKLNGIFWFKGYSKRDDKNVHLTARGLAPEYFYEMFTIMDKLPQGTCIKSEKQKEHLVEGLEEEIDDYISRHFYGSQTQGFFASRTHEEPNYVDIARTARHFYELGQQSRPKISDNSLEGLEEELENYAKLYPFEDAGSYRNLITLARHFAEWGAEHLKG